MASSNGWSALRLEFNLNPLISRKTFFLVWFSISAVGIASLLRSASTLPKTSSMSERLFEIDRAHSHQVTITFVMFGAMLAWSILSHTLNRVQKVQDRYRRPAG